MPATKKGKPILSENGELRITVCKENRRYVAVFSNCEIHRPNEIFFVSESSEGVHTLEELQERAKVKARELGIRFIENLDE